MYAVVNWEDNTSTSENLNGLTGEFKEVGSTVTKNFMGQPCKGEIESLHRNYLFFSFPAGPLYFIHFEYLSICMCLCVVSY